MKSIKVLISDFQFLTREGLIKLMEGTQHFDLIGVLENREQWMEQVTQAQPDVLILDYPERQSDMNANLTEFIKLQASNILVVTNEIEKGHIQNLLSLGVKGIVTKRCSQTEIIHAIESVAKSNRFFCNSILEIVMAPHEEVGQNCEPTDLSKREFEVLELIAKGFRTADIAEKLFVSIHTINSHRKNILKKLKLKSPAQLIVYAIESKLVQV
ncbi:MAG: response regulator transcription factor [Flammeovirgaceae bacterium]|nr:response regulator transcription factor [Flammeovirgaceae bacterium]